MKLSGNVWKFGDDIDTDQIYPGKYLPLTDKKEMGTHAFEGVPDIKDFSAKVRSGDIAIAGRNFGSGSSREHAPIAIRESGIQAVLAISFSRIFYRNAINIGLPIMEIDIDTYNSITQGDKIEIDTETGELRVNGKSFKAFPLSGLEHDILVHNGLINYIKEVML